MNLSTDNWEPFFLNRLYDIQMGNGFDKNKLDEEYPEINLVSRVSYNNGVDVKVKRVDGTEPFEAGLVTVALGGSYLGSCFVQEEPFYTAQNVAVMESKYDEMSQYINIFISGLVRFECRTKYYAFGRELNTHIRTDFNVRLPILLNSGGKPFIDKTCSFSDAGYVPDWNFMERYIKSLHYKPLATKNKNNISCSLDVNNWKEYRFGDLISDIYKAKAINKDNLIVADSPENAIRYITRTSENNGCELLANKQDILATMIEKANAISIGDTTATCFYQDENFITGDHMVIVRADEWLNPYTALFVLTILNNEQYKYSYGRAFLKDRIKNTVLKLPSDSSNNPDWEFIENYIKSLPYGDRIGQ